MRAVARGELVRYVDAGNLERLAFVRSPSPVEGSSLDLVVPDASGPLITLTPVLGVLHCTQAGGPPYWTEV